MSITAVCVMPRATSGASVRFVQSGRPFAVVGEGLIGDDETGTAAHWLRIAGARLAVQYVERAGEWAADIDEAVAWDLRDIRQRLLDRIKTLSEYHQAS